MVGLAAVKTVITRRYNPTLANFGSSLSYLCRIHNEFFG